MELSDMIPTQVGRWPGCDRIKNRVPTALRYVSDSRNPEWGFVAEKSGPGQSTMFKPSLETGDSCADVSNISDHDFTRDFLNAIYGYINQHLAEEGVDGLLIEFSFTVPPTYTDRVVEKFRHIISKTSFQGHKINISLTELEAMAIQVLYNQCDEGFMVRS